MLGQIGLNDVTVGDLVNELGLSGTGLGSILADGGITTLGGLSNLLGLSGLTEGLGTALNTLACSAGSLPTSAMLCPSLPRNRVEQYLPRHPAGR